MSTASCDCSLHFPSLVSASQDEAEGARPDQMAETGTLQPVVPRDETERRNKMRAPRVKQVNTNQMASLKLALLP